MDIAYQKKYSIFYLTILVNPGPAKFTENVKYDMNFFTVKGYSMRKISENHNFPSYADLKLVNYLKIYNVKHNLKKNFKFLF